jgi:hypothetical protein
LVRREDITFRSSTSTKHWLVSDVEFRQLIAAGRDISPAPIIFPFTKTGMKKKPNQRPEPMSVLRTDMAHH